MVDEILRGEISYVSIEGAIDTCLDLEACTPKQHDELLIQLSTLRTKSEMFDEIYKAYNECCNADISDSTALEIYLTKIEKVIQNFSEMDCRKDGEMSDVPSCYFCNQSKELIENSGLCATCHPGPFAMLGVTIIREPELATLRAKAEAWDRIKALAEDEYTNEYLGGCVREEIPPTDAE
jgi:hypothetical protein